MVAKGGSASSISGPRASYRVVKRCLYFVAFVSLLPLGVIYLVTSDQLYKLRSYSLVSIGPIDYRRQIRRYMEEQEEMRCRCSASPAARSETVAINTPQTNCGRVVECVTVFWSFRM